MSPGSSSAPRRVDRSPTRRGSGARASPAPVLFRFAFHRRRRRILELEPVAGAAGHVAGSQALRHDALEAHPAGVREHGRPVGLDVLVAARARRAAAVTPNVALRVSSGSCRRSPPSSSISSAACRLSSASNLLWSGSVRGCCAWQRSYLQAASASGPAIQSSEVSYVYFERVAAAAPATALARSSCPFGAGSILSLPLRPVRLSNPLICATNRSWRGRTIWPLLRLGNKSLYRSLFGCVHNS